MNNANSNTEPNTEPNAEPNAEPGVEQVEPKVYNLDEQVDTERAERLEDLADLARRGQLEAPAGAEEIVEAFTKALDERDETFAQLQRTAADYQNFRRRAVNNEAEARTQATTGVVQSLIPVLDHFDMALGQKTDAVTADQVVGGVRLIRDELTRVLAGFGVNTIAPEPGGEFDPRLHEAMTKQPADGIEPGCIAAVFAVGYQLGERVVRPAKVAVASEDA